MDEDKTDNIIRFRADQADESAIDGWDPYIFSILANSRRSYLEERRRKPRTLDASRRRALLIARSRRRDKR